MLNEIKHKKLLKSKIETLKAAISNSKVFVPSDVSKFVFLCGANQKTGVISERRKAIMKFAKAHLPHTHFFLAEKVFATLTDEGSKDNILDIEHKISDFSDHILIVLESASTFAELGAFSNHDLRKKLIIINDSKFVNEESFINLGPVRAIKESPNGKARVLHYPMRENGVYQLDAIGSTFKSLHEVLKEPLTNKNTAASDTELNPSLSISKSVAMFLHDIVYMTGPVSHKELVEILKILFGSLNFNNVLHLLAILRAFGSLERGDDKLYRSMLDETYYKYKIDVFEIISTFRNYMLKSYPERIYGS